jgi:hypothetical protein
LGPDKPFRETPGESAGPPEFPGIIPSRMITPRPHERVPNRSDRLGPPA